MKEYNKKAQQIEQLNEGIEIAKEFEPPHKHSIPKHRRQREFMGSEEIRSSSERM